MPTTRQIILCAGLTSTQYAKPMIT